MDSTLSKIMIETVVRKYLKEMKENPERSTRNLIDMALQFSEGGFQKIFFQAAQQMMQNENSPYYSLLRNLIFSVDAEHLIHFGMNLGYNSFTLGAAQIRKAEKKWGFHIPWSINFHIDSHRLSKTLTHYHAAITQGEALGIYTFLFFANDLTDDLIALVSSHPDSAFLLFCQPEHIDFDFLDNISEVTNLMLVIQYEENMESLYQTIRSKGLLYSIYYPYSAKNCKEILNGDLFYSVQQFYPIFTILLAKPSCSDRLIATIQKSAEQARTEQYYQTFPWEFYLDNLFITQIISNSSYSSWFDEDGILRDRTGTIFSDTADLFSSPLFSLFQSAFPIKHSGY